MEELLLLLFLMLLLKVSKRLSDNSSFDMRDSLLGPPFNAFNAMKAKAWKFKRSVLQNKERCRAKTL